MKNQKYRFTRYDEYNEKIHDQKFNSEDEAHKFFLGYFGGTLPVGTITNFMERGELSLRDNGDYHQLYFEKLNKK